jgi:hypothetical protein
MTLICAHAAGTFGKGCSCSIGYCENYPIVTDSIR